MLCVLNLMHEATVLGVIGMPGPLELVIIAGIILLLFGKRLPEVMGSLGRSIVEFKKGASDETDRNSDDASQGKVTES